ncbi:hypothetical protein Gogos_017844 [Gossypium gossypioides]|uniref:Uncharacterized protein n=1 Tax=Gossypium gossypioides TaxID=34282 RepID=A0A7J9BC03_GOSGO|nr:hypothetical protein [Gossypium gossypioides]
MRTNSMVRQPPPHVAHPAVPPLAPLPLITCPTVPPLAHLRWTSIGRTQDEKILKKLQNSTGRVGSSANTTLGSTDTIQTSIGRTHCSKKCSFGLGLLSIIWSGLPIQLKSYRYLKDFYQNKSMQ